MNGKNGRSPAVERLEAKALLSTAPAAAVGLPPIIVWPNIPAPNPTPTPTQTIRLAGSLLGRYHAHEIPDAGKFYTFSGSGRVTPLGQVHIQGTVDLPGLLIMPVTPLEGTALPAQIPPVVDATGTLTLSNTRGSVTLSLTAPSHDNAESLPPQFHFSILKATGAFREDHGSGDLQIVVAPAPVRMPLGSGIAIGGLEQGAFHLVFKPTAAS